jgi:hypothetical protein
VSLVSGRASDLSVQHRRTAALSSARGPLRWIDSTDRMASSRVMFQWKRGSAFTHSMKSVLVMIEDVTGSSATADRMRGSPVTSAASPRRAPATQRPKVNSSPPSSVW